MSKVICGLCSSEFESREDCLNHLCSANNATPRDPQFMGDNWREIQSEAVRRGEKRKLTAQGYSDEEAESILKSKEVGQEESTTSTSSTKYTPTL